MIIYDPLMNVLSKYLEQADRILAQKEEVINGFENLFQTNDLLLNGRDTSKTTIQGRIKIFNNYFKSII